MSGKEPGKESTLYDPESQVGVFPTAGITESKALDVLESFSYEQPEMALGEIAGKLGMGKSTVHKILQTLLVRGFVAQNPNTRRYRLGLRNWQLGSQVTGFLDVRNTVSPYLREIANLTGEQLMLWVYEADWAVCVDRIDSRHRIRSYTRMGTVERPEDFASGRCLLAYSGEAAVTAAMERLRKTRGNAAAENLLKRLNIIRSQGYETNPGDLWEEIRAIAAPVFSQFGLEASMSVSGPESRFDEDSMRNLVPHLLNEVAKASQELGHFSNDSKNLTKGRR